MNPLENRPFPIAFGGPGAQLIQLSVPLRITRENLRQCRPQLCVLLQRRSQSIPRRRLRTLRIQDNASPNRHAAQGNTLSNANYAPHASVSQPLAPWTPVLDPQDFQLRISKSVSWQPSPVSIKAGTFHVAVLRSTGRNI
jgi:hypothetical protein